MFAIAPPVLAQTPDGDTPAQETVCDVLREDGITKGLYGLCVAFCEAQDWTSEGETITPDELAELEGAAPSGKILANYNKRKTDADPGMPCVRVEESCPCWTGLEFDDITAAALSYTSCRFRDHPSYSYVWSGQNYPDYFLVYVDTNSGGRCASGYENLDQILFVDPEQYNACKDQITSFQAAFVGACQ